MCRTEETSSALYIEMPTSVAHRRLAVHCTERCQQTEQSVAQRKLAVHRTEIDQRECHTEKAISVQYSD